MSSYTRREDHPERGSVHAVTIVPVLPDGSLGALEDAEGNLSLVHGPVHDGEDWLTGASLRIPVRQAGFRPQRVRVVGSEWEPGALHLIAWAAGDLRSDLGAHDGHLRPFTADELRARLPDGGLVPGGVSGAWIVAEVAASLARDDERAYYADNERMLTPAYLAASTPQGGSGFSGDQQAWERRRGQIADAIGRSGTFLDLGCANGYLMESVHVWAAARGLDVEPHGVDISERLVAEARRRLPTWAERIHPGNALTWAPADGRRYDTVHVLLDTVPPAQRRQLVEHAGSLVAPGGRLLVSHYIAQGGTEAHVGEQLPALGLPEPHGVLPERGGEVPMLAWYQH